MAKNILKLATIQNVKPTDKDQRLSDGGGMFLLIKSNDSKWWRLNFSIDSKRKSLSLGVFIQGNRAITALTGEGV